MGVEFGGRRERVGNKRRAQGGRGEEAPKRTGAKTPGEPLPARVMRPTTKEGGVYGDRPGQPVLTPLSAEVRSGTVLIERRVARQQRARGRHVRTGAEHAYILFPVVGGGSPLTAGGMDQMDRSG